MKATTNIEHCQFTGVKWDAQALQSVQTVAQALLNLTELFKSQNIKIEAMVRIDPPPVVQTSAKKAAKRARGE